MTVSQQTPIATALANGVTTVFPYAFTVLEATDLVVTGTLAGVVTTYTEGVHYNVSGLGTPSGSATFLVAPANGTVITLYRFSVLERDTDYQDNGDLPADTLNLDIDRVWLALQELILGARGSPSAIRVPDGEAVAPLGGPAARANKVLAFDSAGSPILAVPVAGTATALAIQLADTAGSFLIGWVHTFVGAVGRTLGARSRDNLHLSDAGTTADMLTALNRIFAGYPAGFNCQAESGTWILSGTASFTGQRMTLKGMGRQHSIISFQPAGADVALEVNEPSAGGSNQGEISGFGFTGGANTQDKTAIRLVNVANYKISQIGISTGAWLGDSIGLKFEGRQFHHAQDCELACARPVVIGNNLTWPSLSGDHSVLQRMELIGTSATRPVIEFEDGTSFANMTLRNIAVVGGQHGIYWNDTTSTAAGFNLHIDGGRSEQGLDATAYSLYLASTAQTLQNLLVTNFKFGAERNGVYLRNVQRATFINCSFDSTTGTALNITLVAGSKLTLINCARPLAGAVTLTNARCVRRENVTGIGFIEEWVYDSGFNAGALVSDVYLGGTPFNVAVGATAAIADNTFTGFVMVTEAVENVSAVFHLTGTTQTTQEVLDPAGFFSNASGTASSNNIYWDAGSSRFAIRNNRAVQCTYSVLRLGTSA
jgi:hypothetical protein